MPFQSGLKSLLNSLFVAIYLALFGFFEVSQVRNKEKRRRAAWIFPVWDAAAPVVRTGREVRRFFVTPQTLGGVCRRGESACFCHSGRKSGFVELVCGGDPPEAAKGQREGRPTFRTVPRR